MYFPYLRGKQYEMQALLGVPMATYNKMLPIVEHVASASSRFFTRMAQQGRPFILIMNPFHPRGSGRICIATIQSLLVGDLAVHNGLHLGYIVDQHASPAELQVFLTSNPSNEKAVIFRHIPLPANMATIDAVLRANPPKYLVFDETKSRRLQPSLNWHNGHVMLVDGFERQERNSDYPALSNFESNVSTWRTDGLVGMGDYLANGDHFSQGGGQPKVVTLHLAEASPTGLIMHHFSSTMNAGIQGAPAPKFAQACNSLVNSTSVAAMPLSSGITMFQQWDAANHYPGLGSPKQASMQHHLELLAQLV